MRSLIHKLVQLTSWWTRSIGAPMPTFGPGSVVQVTADGGVSEISRRNWAWGCVLMLRPDQALVLRRMLPASAYPRLNDLTAQQQACDWPIVGSPPCSAWRVDEQGSSWTRMAVDLIHCEDRVVDDALKQVRRAGYRPGRIDAQNASSGQPYGVDLRPRASSVVTRRAGMIFSAVLVLIAAGSLSAQILSHRADFQAAQQALSAAQAEAAPALLARRKLLARQDRLSALKSRLDQSGRVSALLETISDILPDQAFLTAAEISDGEISLTGEVASASTVLAAFDRAEAFRNVRFTAPVVRLGSKGRDRFDLGMQANSTAADQ